MKPIGILLACAVAVSACGGAAGSVAPTGPGTTAPPALDDATTVPSAKLPPLRLELITDALDEPVAMALRPGEERLFIAEKTGRIRTVTGNTLDDGTFLDLTDIVLSEKSEQGLLGLTFDGAGRRLFVVYTDHSRALRIYEYAMAGDRVDLRSAKPILTVEQPYSAHQGGAIAFGPDGYLWIGFGDGGGIGDPKGNGQNPANLLGTVVRIDVDAYHPYAVPPDNPFVGADGGAPEIWAFGLRNPWRITFDGGFVYVADVGQYAWEEVNILPVDAGGANLGWSVLEGNECYEADSCDTEGLIPPTFTIEHYRSCAIVGGPVYRGAAMPELTGHYFYGDFCVGWVRSLFFDGEAVVAEHDWEADLGRAGHITTFGLDAAGEIMLANQEGSLYRIVPAR